MKPGNPDDPFGEPAGPERTVIRPMPGRGPGQGQGMPGSTQVPRPMPQSGFQPPPPPGYGQQPLPPAGFGQAPPPGFGQPQAPPGYGAAPQPGAQAPGYPPQAPQPPRGLAAHMQQSMPAEVADIARASNNPLVAASTPLLGFVARLRNVAGPVDIGPVRDRVYEELRQVAGAGRNAGIPPEQLRAAHYALCATVDDVVMNTPWGAHSGWSRRTMVNAFHGDVEGGERFYAHLENMLTAPAQNRGVREVMYCSLSLGFEGRYRLHPRGHAEHARVRENLYNTLRSLLGPSERELSPDWRGLNVPARVGRRGIPLWVLAALAALLAALIYAGLMFALAGLSDQTEMRVSNMVPFAPLRLARVVIPPRVVDVQRPPPAPPPEPDPPRPPPNDFQRLLQREIAEGLVTVQDDGRRAQITISATADMFRSGYADINDRLRDILVRIGRELGPRPGPVVVTGHTDNVPLSAARRRVFPSNVELSQARAANAGQVLAEQMGAGGAARVTTRGVGETRPVADNRDEAGRARNRRVDILFTRDEEAPPQARAPGAPGR